MSEPISIVIEAEAWRQELFAIVRDILDCEPVAAIHRINALLGELEERAAACQWEPLVEDQATTNFGNPLRMRTVTQCHL